MMGVYSHPIESNLPRPVHRNDVRLADFRPVAKTKGKLLQVRVNSAEKQAFSDAAALDGKKISEWIRDRLRRLSRQELEEAGQAVAFLSSQNAENTRQ